jgi:glutamine cyclotransferase
MRFGLMNKLVLFLLLMMFAACNPKISSYISYRLPQEGEIFNTAKPVKIQLDFPKDQAIDTVSYWIDNTLFAQKTNTDSVWLHTKNLPLGNRIISVIVKYGSQKDTINRSIVITTKQKPKTLGYQVVNRFPHDTTAYTQGLSFVNGQLIESTGQYGQSKLKRVDLKSGKTLQSVKLKDSYFGEGSVQVGQKIIVLTWQNNIALRFDARSFKELDSFRYASNHEGWGLTFDGQHLWQSDGTNRIWKLNVDHLSEQVYIQVYNHLGQVENINELEFIEGKIWANVYLSNKIVVINPHSGLVEAELDLSKLVPRSYLNRQAEANDWVLNGIAYDERNKRLFVTGKKWPQLFEISVEGL